PRRAPPEAPHPGVGTPLRRCRDRGRHRQLRRGLDPRRAEPPHRRPPEPAALMRRAAAIALMLAAGAGGAATPPADPAAVRASAADIAALAPEFPQLAQFRASDQRMDDLRIDYDYRTHRSSIRGGWRAAAPEPDADGIWFAINFHDPDSIAQIDTQPVMPN